MSEGGVDPALAEEFPGLALAVREVPGPAAGESGVRERLDAIAGRIRGQTAIELRREPVPAAYRSFFRQVGLDPDADMTPVEAATARRLFHGGVRPPGAVESALELAVLETSVPVYAFDASEVEGSLAIRTARRGEQLEDADGAVRPVSGRLVLSDRSGPLCRLFEAAGGRGAAVDGAGPLLLAAVGVPGVPAMALEEALDIAGGALGA